MKCRELTNSRNLDPRERLLSKSVGGGRSRWGKEIPGSQKTEITRT